MAENFDKPIPADLEVPDRLQNERDMNKMLATGNTAAAVGKPVGAKNLSAPGSYSRILTQWNGTAFVGFNLSLERAQITGPIIDLGISSCVIGSNIGAGNPGYGFDANDFFDYDRAANRYRLSIGGVEKILVDSATSWDLTQSVRHQSNVNLYALINKTNAPLDQKSWIREVNDTQIRHLFQNDAASANTIYDTVNRIGMTLTTRVLNEQGGQLVVGQGITPDGVSALQTTTLKAQSLSLTAQPYAIISASNRLSAGVVTSEFLNITGIASQVGVNYSYSSADQSIVVNEAGSYLLTGTVGSNISQAGPRTTIDIPLNGSAVVSDIAAVLINVVAAESYFANISCLLKLNAGDKFRLRLTHTAPAQSYLTLAPAPLKICKVN